MEVGNPSALYLLVLFVPVVLIAAKSLRSLNRPRRIVALAIRLLVLAGLIGALADVRMNRHLDRVAVAYLLDTSSSIPAAERDRAAEWVRSAIAAKGTDDLAAVVTFASEPLVERSPSTLATLPEIAGEPKSDQTDIAAAIQLSLGLLPSDVGRRIVVLTDGFETKGDARQAAAIARAAGVQVSTVPLEANTGSEVFVAGVDTPGLVRQGERFQTRVSVESTEEGKATLHLVVDGRVSSTQEIILNRGTNTFVLPHEPLASGFHSLRVQVEPLDNRIDTRAENNEGTGYVVVGGESRTLLVEGTPGESDYLARLLRAGGLVTETKAAASLPTEMVFYQNYESVIFVNVPARAVDEAQQTALRDAVQKVGVGLVVVGGDQSYGAGGYARTPLAEALPVKMERRGLQAESGAAILLVIDTSGSMGASVGGTTKMALAREAGLQALENLSDSDVVGVLAFEDRPKWIVEPEKLGDRRVAKEAISQLQPGGGTEIYSSLLEAEQSMMRVSARVRHIVLLTDGISPPGDYSALAARLRQNVITLSTIGVGLDADQELLRQLADLGAGRYYDGSDPFDLPKLLVKETLEIARAAIVEEEFRPLVTGQSPILEGIPPASLPSLRGYIATTAQSTAQTLLTSRQGDPILAEWQYGLGRVLSWTSDAKNRWAAGWLEWPEAVGFWSRLVKRSFPNPQDQSFQTQVAAVDGVARVTVDATGDAGAGGLGNFLPLQIETVKPNGETATIQLDQVAPGRYSAEVPAADAGSYFVRVSQPANGDQPTRSQAIGFSVDGSAEYRYTGRNEALLVETARVGGGRVLVSPAESVRHDLTARGGEPIWGLLTALAVALFLGDVAARRVRVSLTTAKKVLARTAALRQRFGGAALPSAVGARLLAAKRRAPISSPSLVSALAERRLALPAARRHPTSGHAPPTAPAPSRPTSSHVPGRAQPATRRPMAPVAPAAPGQPGELGARLLAAKQRAKS